MTFFGNDKPYFACTFETEKQNIFFSSMILLNAPLNYA